MDCESGFDCIMVKKWKKMDSYKTIISKRLNRMIYKEW